MSYFIKAWLNIVVGCFFCMLSYSVFSVTKSSVYGFSTIKEVSLPVQVTALRGEVYNLTKNNINIYYTFNNTCQSCLDVLPIVQVLKSKYGKYGVEFIVTILREQEEWYPKYVSLVGNFPIVVSSYASWSFLDKKDRILSKKNETWSRIIVENRALNDISFYTYKVKNNNTQDGIMLDNFERLILQILPSV